MRGDLRPADHRNPDRNETPVDPPDADRRFESTLNKILSVPKAELERREAAYKKTRRRKKSRRARPNAR